MSTCRIIPLGGLGEVGKNMTAYEAEGSIVIVDAGLAFPRDEHLGVDLVLPEFTYLREREHMIRGVVLTHGHKDHVGSLPYLMREVKVPVVVAIRLTLGLAKSKLDEHGLLSDAELREVGPRNVEARRARPAPRGPHARGGPAPGAVLARPVPDRARPHGPLDPG